MPVNLLNNMHVLVQKYGLIAVGVVIGAIAGYAYYFYVGCSSGSCSITSDPTNSTLYGMVMGGLFFDILKKKKKDDKVV